MVNRNALLFPGNGTAINAKPYCAATFQSSYHILFPRTLNGYFTPIRHTLNFFDLCLFRIRILSLTGRPNPRMFAAT